MNARVHAFLPAQPMPGQRSGALAWLRGNLFSSLFNSLLTLVVAALLGLALYHAFDWFLLYAVAPADLAACNQVRGLGACWGVVSEKGRFILMGRYPALEQWRPVLATALMLATVLASCIDRKSVV